MYLYKEGFVFIIPPPPTHLLIPAKAGIQVFVVTNITVNTENPAYLKDLDSTFQWDERIEGRVSILAKKRSR